MDPSAFTVYQRLSTEREVIWKWLDKHLLDIFRAHLTEVTKGRPFRLLSVGCGTGDKDEHIVDKALLFSTDVMYTAFDPSDDQLKVFKRNVCDVRKHHANFEVLHMRTDEFEEYFKENSSSVPPYDFITMIHMLYYVKDKTACVDFFHRQCLSSGGMLLIFMQAPETGTAKLLKEFCATIHGTDENKYQFSEYVDNAVSHLGLVCEVQTLTSDLDVTSCFEDSVDGAQLLDFLIGIPNTRKNRPAYLDAFLKRMKEMSIEINGKFILKNTVKAYIIQKPK